MSSSPMSSPGEQTLSLPRGTQQHPASCLSNLGPPRRVLRAPSKETARRPQPSPALNLGNMSSSSSAASSPAMPPISRSAVRRLTAAAFSDTDESSFTPSVVPSPVASVGSASEAPSPVAKVDARRLGALLEVSRACGTGLKTALSRLDEERAAGKEALAAVSAERASGPCARCTP